jgi:hypothetical protein
MKYHNKMSNKITSIIEISKSHRLPDGVYIGKYGGYVIELNYQDKKYELRTEEEVRGIGFNVVVAIKDGIAVFEIANN